MSFNLVTALWIARIFIVYTLMVVILPCAVLHRFLKGRSLGQKFVFSVVLGNFFYIMLVLLWGLFHITSRYVLILSTLAIPAVLLYRNRQYIWQRYLEPVWIHLVRFLKRENSFRFTLRIFFRWAGRNLKKGMKAFFLAARRNLFEFVLFVGCSSFILYFFSITNHFGPRASDLVVHMYWINEVDNGNLFCDGIYPFGMHALLYYIHAVFGISTARLVLLFAPVQTFYIFTMLLVFLKEICRFRYTPYLTYIAFAVGNYLFDARFSRYYCTLPQEFGMIFILPCAVALIHFFRAVRDENAEYKRMKKEKLLYTQIDGKHRWRESTVWLWILILSFGLTLSAHFYITIVAGLLVVAAAVSYIRYIFNPKTFRRLVIAAVLSIMIPVFPMAVSYATGTPLQGSLFWALSVMGVDTSGDAEEEDTVEETDEEDTQIGVSQEADTQGDAQAGVLQETDAAAEDTREVDWRTELSAFCEQIRKTVESELESWGFRSAEYVDYWFYLMGTLIILVPVMWILREWEYSRYLVMVLVNTVLMLMLSMSSRIGLPMLIDPSRSYIFACYTLLVCFSLAVDGVLVVLSKIIRVKKLMQALSLVLAVSFAFYTVDSGLVKVKSVNGSSLQRDGAALCTFDIMEHYPEQKWTIVSCNEERNMVSPVAWHYEVIDFLQGMEDYEEDYEMYIPTQYVFFFVEKVSVNYAYGEFTDIDATVSEEWASMELPGKNSLDQYQGTNRMIVNSRMYYWAQEYMKRFPNEMKVYYEDDEFICYYIEQNEYYLNNFAIDYGYNSRGGAQ